MVLICISLKVRDIEQSFKTCDYLSSMEKCVFSFLVRILNWLLLLLLLLSHRRSLYISGINHLSKIWFAKIFLQFYRLFFHSVDCLYECSPIFSVVFESLYTAYIILFSF